MFTINVCESVKKLQLLYERLDVKYIGSRCSVFLSA